MRLVKNKSKEKSANFNMYITLFCKFVPIMLGPHKKRWPLAGGGNMGKEESTYRPPSFFSPLFPCFLRRQDGHRFLCGPSIKVANIVNCWGTIKSGKSQTFSV
jgi:hypothetical protein